MSDDRAADHTLVQAVRSGTPGAFEQLVRRHQRLVGFVVQRLVRDPEDTRELCQETFLRVHRTLHQWRGESRLATWIGRVAYSIALRHLEKKRIDLVAADAADDESDEAVATLLDQAESPLRVEDAAAAAQMQRHLHSAIEALPPLQRTLLTLYHLEELPIGEIAQITGLPNNTIKSHLLRCRLKLRASLGAAWGLKTNEGNPRNDDDESA